MMRCWSSRKGGERLVGQANVRAMREAYPSEPGLTTQRIRGGGELWKG